MNENTTNESKPLSSKCTNCGKEFKPGDKVFYSILDDDPSQDDICEACAENVTMMAYEVFPFSEVKPDGRED